MTGNELKRLRNNLGMTQLEMAGVLGALDRTIRNYEAGKVKIPLTTQKLTNLIFLHRIKKIKANLSKKSKEINDA